GRGREDAVRREPVAGGDPLARGARRRPEVAVAPAGVVAERVQPLLELPHGGAGDVRLREAESGHRPITSPRPPAPAGRGTCSCSRRAGTGRGTSAPRPGRSRSAAPGAPARG